MRASGNGVFRALVVAAAMIPLNAFASGGDAPAPVPPTEEELAAIEEVAWRIAHHQEAREKALDRLARMKKYSSLHEGETVIEGDRSWRVLFLKDPPPKDRRKRPLIMLQVQYDPASGEAGYPNMMVPPREAEARIVSHYRAGQIARAGVLGKAQHPEPLEEVVFRLKKGPFRVYLTSTAAPEGYVRIGGDHIVRVASSGRRVESIEPLHAGPPINVSLAVRDDGDPTLHTHAVLDRPTATDVAIVMRYPSIAPHLILTPHFIYRINAEGRIAFLGENSMPPEGGGDADMERP